MEKQNLSMLFSSAILDFPVALFVFPSMPYPIPTWIPHFKGIRLCLQNLDKKYKCALFSF